MKGKRLAVWTAALAALLAVAVEPVAAQSSLNEQLIGDLNEKLLYAAIPIAVLVEAVLVYTVYRFSRTDEEPDPTQENRRLEITWTVATAIVLLFVGFGAYQLLGVPAIGGVTGATYDNPTEAAITHNASGAVGPPQNETNAVQVEVVAQKYSWTFNYANETVGGNESNYVSSPGTLVIPKDRPVYLHVVSEDWIHSVHIPELGVKQDAMPGQYNTVTTEAYEEGTYQLYCAEYCGVGHSSMLGQVEVVSQEEYRNWLDQQKQSMRNESG